MPTAPESPAPAPLREPTPADAGPHVAKAVGWAIYVPAPPELPPGAEVVGYEVFADAAPASAAPSADGAPTDTGPSVARAVGRAIYVPASPTRPSAPDTLAADVDRLTARRVAATATLDERTAELRAATDAFTDGTGPAEAMAAAQSARAVAAQAVDAIEAKLAPLRAQLDARVAAERAEDAAADRRRAVFDAANACAAHLRAQLAARARAVKLLAPLLDEYVAERTAMRAAQRAFFDALAAHNGGRVSDHWRAAERLAAADGLDLSAVTVDNGAPPMALTRLVRPTPLDLPNAGLAGWTFDGATSRLVSL